MLTHQEQIQQRALETGRDIYEVSKMRTDPKFITLASFQALDKPHARIHELAYEAASMLESNRLDQVDLILTSIEDASSKVIHHLDELQQDLLSKS